MRESREAGSIESGPPGASVFPASYGQERLWFLNQMNPATPVYNSTLVLDLRGSLNASHLESAVAKLHNRHETLRTTFQRAGGSLYQVINDHLKPDFGVADVENEEQALILIRERVDQPFDLKSGPLARIHLYRIARDRHLMSATLHHTVADGWSLDVLWRDLGELYRAESEGSAANLPPLEIQYADFASWQRDQLEGNGASKVLEYWKEKLAGSDQPIELPFDRQRPPSVSYRGDSVPIRLPGELTGQLMGLAKQTGSTVFTTLTAAVAALLSRYSGDRVVSIGTPVAGRDRTELELLIGFFVNTVVLRVPVDAKTTFRSLLRTTTGVALDAFDHQQVPFEKLVAELDPRREASYTPLFQVMLALQNTTRRKGSFGPLEAHRIDLLEKAVPFELTVEFEEEAESVEGSLGYATDLFDRRTARRMAGHLVNLLQGAVSEPDRQISRISLLEEKEAFAVPAHIASSEPPSAFQTFLDRAAARPDVYAVKDDAGSWTFADLLESAGRIAGGISKFGLNAEAAVGVFLPPGRELIATMIALAGVGACYVPVDRSNPPDRVARLLDGCDAKLVIIKEDIDLQSDRPTLRVGHSLEFDPVELNPRPRGSAVAYTLYTSGSTGTPKGVMVPWLALDNLVRWHNETFPPLASMAVGQVAGIGFDASVWEVWTALSGGATVVIAPHEVRGDPAELRRWIAREQLDRCFMPTPLAERSLENHYWPDETKLEILFTGGDQLVKRPDPTLRFRVINCYGPTECAVISSIDDVQASGLGALPPIGMPIDGASMYILDGELQQVPPGVTGEIYIAGKGLARGYTGPASLTAGSFLPDPFAADGSRMYRSGDLGRWLSDGTIEMRGRVDEQVKIRGLRVELGEVEAALASYPAVQQAVAIAKPDASGERRLLAYATPAELPIEALREELRTTLPAYMVPESIVALDALPLTPNGKVDKRALPEPPRKTAIGARPLTPTERVITASWVEVLGYDPGPDMKFFEAGGSSLKMVDLLEHLDSRFAGVFKLGDLFTLNTVAEMAGHADQHANSSPEKKSTAS